MNMKSYIVEFWRKVSLQLGGYFFIPFIRRHPFTRKPLIIIGLPRCGSTWIGRILSKHPDLYYHFEPLNPDYSRLVSKHFVLRDNTNCEPKLTKYLERLPLGNCFCLFPIIFQPIWRLTKAKGYLIKDVHALFSLPIITKHMVDILLLVRHPCGIAKSHMLRGIKVPLEDLLVQMRENSVYKNCKITTRLEQAMNYPDIDKNQWIRFGVYWELGYQLAIEHDLHKDGLVIKYEELCWNTEELLIKIINYFKLPANRRVLQFSAETTSTQKPTYTRRNSIKISENWKQQLKANEISSIEKGIALMGSIAYKEIYH